MARGFRSGLAAGAAPRAGQGERTGARYYGSVGPDGVLLGVEAAGLLIGACLSDAQGRGVGPAVSRPSPTRQSCQRRHPVGGSGGRCPLARAGAMPTGRRPPRRTETAATPSGAREPGQRGGKLPALSDGFISRQQPPSDTRTPRGSKQHPPCVSARLSDADRALTRQSYGSVEPGGRRQARRHPVGTNGAGTSRAPGGHRRERGAARHQTASSGAPVPRHIRETFLS